MKGITQLDNQIQDNMLMFNPSEIALQRARRKEEMKMNIAAEMLIAEQVGIYYTDIMSDVDTDLYASSRSLISWMKDRTYTYRGEKRTREGIVTLYKRDHPEHFIDGVWEGKEFPNFIQYTCTYLIDKDFTNRMAPVYKRSLTNREWFNQAFAVAGLTLLESMDINKLNSNTAQRTLKLNQNNKELLSALAKVIGRSTKNHNAEYLRNEMKQITNMYIRSMQKGIMGYFEAVDDETAILDEYKQEFMQGLEMARTRALHGISA